jgi:hypothetical protein
MTAKIKIADTESDGLLDEATRLWCIAGTEYDNESEDAVLFGPDSISAGLSWLWDCDVLVGHNFIKHDLPLLKKLFDWEPRSHQTVIDTLVFSRMLYPKRPVPDGYKGKATHSIEAWGYRVGRGKPEHEDWSKYTPEMGVRCQQDAIINRLILLELEREAEEQEMFYHKAKSK